MSALDDSVAHLAQAMSAALARLSASGSSGQLRVELTGLTEQLQDVVAALEGGPATYCGWASPTTAVPDDPSSLFD